MTVESRIDTNSRVGEYLVQCAGPHSFEFR